MPEEYLMYRLEFFHKYTLPSLLNQTNQNFEIFMQLGQRHKAITDAYKWHPRVTLCYNFGAEHYTKIKNSYLIVSRIDSDDMFHKDAIQLIKTEAEMRIKAKSCYYRKNRLVLVFRKNICWDMVNGCIIPHEKATSPFHTHIYPNGLFKRWAIFRKSHFNPHGDPLTGDRGGYDMPEGNVCVTKHGQNVSHLKRGLPPLKLSDEQKEILIKIGKSDTNLLAYDNAQWDHDEMAKTLADFGVSYQPKQYYPMCQSCKHWSRINKEESHGICQNEDLGEYVYPDASVSACKGYEV